MHASGRIRSTAEPASDSSRPPAARQPQRRSRTPASSPPRASIQMTARGTGVADGIMRLVVPLMRGRTPASSPPHWSECRRVETDHCPRHVRKIEQLQRRAGAERQRLRERVHEWPPHRSCLGLTSARISNRPRFTRAGRSTGRSIRPRSVSLRESSHRDRAPSGEPTAPHATEPAPQHRKRARLRPSDAAAGANVSAGVRGHDGVGQRRRRLPSPGDVELDAE